MDKKSKLFFAFAAGAIVGAGILALFTTDKGKAIVEKARGKMDELSDDVKSKFSSLESEIAELLKDNESEDKKEA